MATLTVGQLEEALFTAFPRDDAESWDRPGLQVGDRAATVERVALNLDPSVEAVHAAADAGCNVLVTHHPAFIGDGPNEFAPAADAHADGPGRMVYEAAARGVHVIAMHTNADRALAVRERFAEVLGLPCEGNFEQLMDGRDAKAPGFGALFDAGGVELIQLASTCQAAFGGAPRVWGDPSRSIRRVAFLNGSWGDPGLYALCTGADIDCMVVGETRYHRCVDAHPHLSVIDLGHDRSELPIVDVLAETVAAAGVDEADIVRLDCAQANWWTPRTED